MSSARSKAISYLLKIKSINFVKDIVHKHLLKFYAFNDILEDNLVKCKKLNLSYIVSLRAKILVYVILKCKNEI